MGGPTGQSTVGLFCRALSWAIHAVRCLLKPVAWTRARVKPDLNRGLWVMMMTMMGECRFIGCNQCASPVWDADHGRAAGKGVWAGGARERNCLYFLLHFALSLNLLEKKKKKTYFYKVRCMKYGVFLFVKKKLTCSSFVLLWTTHSSCLSGVLVFSPHPC